MERPCIAMMSLWPSLPKISFPLCPSTVETGKLGDFFVPYLILFSDFTGKTAESGTEDDCCLRLGVHLSLQKAAVS